MLLLDIERSICLLSFFQDTPEPPFSLIGVSDHHYEQLLQTCPRCAAVSCSGEESQHANFYLNPTSRNRKKDAGFKETGGWCECCLGRLWQVLKPATREFLLLLAETQNVWADLPLTKGQKTAATLDICRGVKQLAIGVDYSSGEIQGDLETPKDKWGLPFSYDARARSWKKYLLPSKGAELVKKFAEHD